MEFQEAVDYLYSLRAAKKSYGIERMQLFTDKLGLPPYPMIHVAGTNGKGSVCAFLESIFRAASYKTGLFTSPHLLDLGERVQTNRVALDHEHLLRYIIQLKSYADAAASIDEDSYPSFFEFITAIAFEHFKNEKVSIGIIECGLGGRLDATNIIHPSVSVITSISLDHTEILGDTIEAIAREKAGIIKNGTPLVIGRLPEAAKDVIVDIAASKGAPVSSVEERFGSDLSHYPSVPQGGDFQRINAAIAMCTVECMRDRFKIDTAAIDQGIQSMDWPGRWQSIHYKTGHRIVLDSTHNPEGISFLERNLTELTKAQKAKPYILVGTLGMERAKSILPAIAPFAAGIFLVEPKQERSVATQSMRAVLGDLVSCPITDVKMDTFFESSKGIQSVPLESPVVITGSIYLVAEALSYIQGSHSKIALQDQMPKLI